MQQESLFKNRDKILSKVPFFWMEVFQKQESLRNLLDEVDLEILKSLTKFDVIRTTVDDDTDSFKMIFVSNCITSFRFLCFIPPRFQVGAFCLFLHSS